ncbi:hypothetical protein COU61_00395, partial [Candidatus Pacearchaeota archaeon CG10_big_fil_rev_8_21_14_0_10_35_13]
RFEAKENFIRTIMNAKKQAEAGKPPTPPGTNGATGGGEGGDGAYGSGNNNGAITVNNTPTSMNLVLNSPVIIKIDDEEHKITLKAIKGNKATIIVESTLITKIIEKDEGWKFDVDDDGTYDVIIYLNGIWNAESVQVTIKKIDEARGIGLNINSVQKMTHAELISQGIILESTRDGGTTTTTTTTTAPTEGQELEIIRIRIEHSLEGEDYYGLRWNPKINNGNGGVEVIMNINPQAYSLTKYKQEEWSNKLPQKFLNSEGVDSGDVTLINNIMSSKNTNEYLERIAEVTKYRDVNHISFPATKEEAISDKLVIGEVIKEMSAEEIGKNINIKYLFPIEEIKPKLKETPKLQETEEVTKPQETEESVEERKSDEVFIPETERTLDKTTSSKYPVIRVVFTEGIDDTVDFRWNTALNKAQVKVWPNNKDDGNEWITLQEISKNKELIKEGNDGTMYSYEKEYIKKLLKSKNEEEMVNIISACFITGGTTRACYLASGVSIPYYSFIGFPRIEKYPLLPDYETKENYYFLYSTIESNNEWMKKSITLIKEELAKEKQDIGAHGSANQP